MKRSIFDQQALDEILTRVHLLTAGTRGKWGKPSTQQMTRHLSEAGRMAFDEVNVPDQSNVITRTLVKWLFLRNIKPPGREKGNIKTFPQVDIIALGIEVNSLDDELRSYEGVLRRIVATKNLSSRHPLFGRMSRDDWGYLTYAHADYHLTQFNV